MNDRTDATKPHAPAPTSGVAVGIFRGSNPEHQSLIREILREERDVQHLRRRADIYQRIYEHIKRIIK